MGVWSSWRRLTRQGKENIHEEIMYYMIDECIKMLLLEVESLSNECLVPTIH